MMFGKKTLIAASLVMGLATGASAYTINDQGADAYWGYDKDRDIHGSADRFSVFGVNLKNDSTNLYVDIFTNFDEHSRYSFGDLFISTDGWNPTGSASTHYIEDNYHNGEDWEYAVDTSSDTLYKLPGSDTYSYDKAIVTSTEVHGGGDAARQQQEVKVWGRYADSVADDNLVDWSGFNSLGQLNVISYTIALSDLGLDPLIHTEIGIKWGMSCANDTVEGSFVVPEPATLGLIGLSLVGLGLSRRKKA